MCFSWKLAIYSGHKTQSCPYNLTQGCTCAKLFVNRVFVAVKVPFANNAPAAFASNNEFLTRTSFSRRTRAEIPTWDCASRLLAKRWTIGTTKQMNIAKIFLTSCGHITSAETAQFWA